MTTNIEDALQALLSVARDRSAPVFYRILAAGHLDRFRQTKVAADALLEIVFDKNTNNPDKFSAAAELWRIEERDKAIVAYTEITKYLPSGDKLQQVFKEAVTNIKAAKPAPLRSNWWEPEEIMPAPPAPVPPAPAPTPL